MAIRTRSAYLQELATQQITQQTVDTGSGSGLGEISGSLIMFISRLFSFCNCFTRYEAMKQYIVQTKSIQKYFCTTIFHCFVKEYATERTCERNLVFWIHLQDFWEALAVAKTRSTLLLSISPSALLQCHGAHTWCWMILLMWVALRMSICMHFSSTRQLNKVLITNIVSTYILKYDSHMWNPLKSLKSNQPSVNGCRGNWGREK